MSIQIPLAALLGALLLLLSAPDAEAGTYTVRQCQHSPPQNHFHEGIGEAFPNPGPYGVSAGSGICAEAAGDYSIAIRPQSSALSGQSGQVSFRAPEGTTFTGVSLQARLRSERGHRSRLAAATPAGVDIDRFAIGDSGPAEFEEYTWPAPGTQATFGRLNAVLACANPEGVCPETNEGAFAGTNVRNVRLTVRDTTAPTVELTGPMVDGGWQRGTSDLTRAAHDRGGGLTYAPVLVNGVGVSELTTLPCELVSGTSDASRLTPCSTGRLTNVELETQNEPFVDGENQLLACATDYGANANLACTEEMIRVDNTPPTLRFRNQLPEDPELISVPATDQTSGLNGTTARIEFRNVGGQWRPLATELKDGELVARVDSVAEPPGEYEFRASVEDNAGNIGTTTVRDDGTSMTLTFPLKDLAHVDAHLGNGATDQLVPFRGEGVVVGRLLDAEGTPIAGEEVTVTEVFAEGSLIDRRVRTVATDNQGQYRSLLPGGPSRDVEVEFAGSRRYLADSRVGLDFDVRGDATFNTSKRRVKAGSSVSFLGRVKRYYAQIPKNGKLVEVQVKSGNDWITLHEATGTDGKGRVEIRHRFRRFYTQRVTFTFRLKVTPETGWPYRGATTTKRRKVTVVPR